MVESVGVAKGVNALDVTHAIVLPTMMSETATVVPRVMKTAFFGSPCFCSTYVLLVSEYASRLSLKSGEQLHTPGLTSLKVRWKGTPLSLANAQSCRDASRLG